MRYCPGCEREKSDDRFGNDRTKPDGKRKQCKDCDRATRLARVANDPDFKPRAAAYLKGYYAKNREACRAQQAGYYREHRGEILSHSHEWYVRNKGRILAAGLEYRKTRRDVLAAKSRQWYRDNPGRARIAKRAHYRAHIQTARLNGRLRRHERRSRLRGPGNDFTADQWIGLLEYFNYHCGYCGAPFDRLEVEHMQPISRQGKHTESNIIPACKSCNCRKNDRTLAEYLIYLDRIG